MEIPHTALEGITLLCSVTANLPLIAQSSTVFICHFASTEILKREKRESRESQHLLLPFFLSF